MKTLFFVLFMCGTVKSNFENPYIYGPDRESDYDYDYDADTFYENSIEDLTIHDVTTSTASTTEITKAKSDMINTSTNTLPETVTENMNAINTTTKSTKQDTSGPSIIELELKKNDTASTSTRNDTHEETSTLSALEISIPETDITMTSSKQEDISAPLTLEETTERYTFSTTIETTEQKVLTTSTYNVHIAQTDSTDISITSTSDDITSTPSTVEEISTETDTIATTIKKTTQEPTPTPANLSAKTQVENIEDIFMFPPAPIDCHFEDVFQDIRTELNSVKDGFDGDVADLDANVRWNTASVTIIHDGMKILEDAMNELKEMMQRQRVHVQTTPFPTTTRRGPVRCNSPFRREGGGCFYLEEFTKRTWSEAVEFCRNIGASLAEPDDLPRLSRHLHDTIGELGTRVRWPLWLGGQRLLPSGTDSWFWLKKETKIPSDVWEGAYLRDNWNCMALDGYNEYKPTSLNCDVRRRFLCEEKDSW